MFIHFSFLQAKRDPPKKQKKNEDISDELVELACKRLQKPPNEYETITAAWAVELKKMEPIQQMLAKKAINDIGIVRGPNGDITP